MKATFGAGCFWHVEQVFAKIPGVVSTAVGYAGGDLKDPSYDQVCTGNTELSPDGENVYYINKKKIPTYARGGPARDGKCRTAPVKRSTACGTVTRISEFTAEEKRRAIEDLVGMSTFDEKKLAAQKQLEAADNKLNIAFATMVQIKKQIEDLEAQRNLQMRYNYMTNEIAQLKLNQLLGKSTTSTPQKKKNPKYYKRCPMR